jgi:erythromycin esterase-like protein
MRSLTITFLLLFLTYSIKGQSKTDFSKLYIKDLYKGSSQLKSISPRETNFDDFEPIGKEIGDAKIVLLGDPSHGDGGAILMKTRLLKYLHEKKGFDVLLFEADLYSIMFHLALVKDTASVNVAARENIYTCWSESKVSQDLWAYYKEQLVGKNPISLGGVDCRHAGAFAKNTLSGSLTNVLNSSSFNTSSNSYKVFAKDVNYILQNEFSSKKDSVDIQNFNSEIKRIEECLTFSTLDSRIRNLWLIEVNNIKGLFDLVINGKSRDIVMAQNFSYLMKYVFPDKKVIVWSHNNHNVLDVNTYASFNPDFAKQWYATNTYQGFTYLGSDIFREFNNQVYSLAITSGSGSFSPRFFGNDYFHADFTKTAKVPKSGEQSLERYLESKKSRVLFIPLPNAQGRPSGYPWFSARLLDLTYEAKMDYTAAFDGVIYIDKTVDLNGQ